MTSTPHLQMAWRGAGDSTVYKACSGADLCKQTSTWQQYAVRHQLPVQLDDGLTAPKWWPTSLPTPQARYSVSSVAVCCHMLNLTEPTPSGVNGRGGPPESRRTYP